MAVNRRPPWVEYSELDLSKATPFDRVNKWYELACAFSTDTHETPLLKIMSLESVVSSPTPDSPHHSVTVFTLTVPRSLCNMGYNLHGGAVALIFDMCTSMSINALSHPGFWDSGHVSRTLNCTYLRPVPEGGKIWIESEVVHLGKKMGLTRGVIKDENGKKFHTLIF